MTNETDAAPDAPAPAPDAPAPDAPAPAESTVLVEKPVAAAPREEPSRSARDGRPSGSSFERRPREGFDRDRDRDRDRDGDDGDSQRRGPGPRRRRGRRAPIYTPDEVKTISYKDIERLRRLISERGRIDPRRKTGLTATDQRRLATAIKRARHVALLPYTAEHMRLTAQFRQASRQPRAPEPESVAPSAEAGEGQTATSPPEVTGASSPSEVIASDTSTSEAETAAPAVVAAAAAATSEQAQSPVATEGAEALAAPAEMTAAAIPAAASDGAPPSRETESARSDSAGQEHEAVAESSAGEAEAASDFSDPTPADSDSQI